MNRLAAPTIAPAPSAYPFASLPPARRERPDDRAALCALLAGTSGAVVPIDGARERAVSAPLEAGEWMAVDVGGLARLVDWQPDDLTVTVETAMPLAELAGRLATRGQWLPLEGPGIAGVTVGHVVSEALAGDRFSRFGGPRRHLIGTTVADGHGRLTRAGGRLVKNVAGYDLMKLHAGARETLGLLVEMTFRLRPLPEATIRLEGRASGIEEAAGFARGLSLAGLEPDRFVVLRAPAKDGIRVELEFSGFVEDIREEADAARAIDGVEGWHLVESPGRSVLDAAPDGDGDRLELDVFAPLREAAAAWARLEDWSAAHPAWGRRMEWHPLADRWRIVGDPARRVPGDASQEPAVRDLGDVAPDPAPDADGRSVTDLGRLRSELRAVAGRMVVRGFGFRVDGEADAERVAHVLEGDPPPTRDVVRRLKAALDPDRRFQPGRFFQGL